MIQTYQQLQRVGIVGPCTAGKSTLIQRLKLHGISAIHIAQEHSFVKDLWQRLSKPDWLIFLDVSYPVSLQRRPINWTEAEYQEQQYRLRHAREHCHLYLQTDSLPLDEVCQRILFFLTSAGAISAL